MLDPITTSIVTYLAIKVGEKVLDKVLEKPFEHVGKILPVPTFRERLTVVIQQSAEEYKQNAKNVVGDTFTFEQSQLVISQFLEAKIYKLTSNLLTPDLFEANPNIAPTTQAELDRFFNLLIVNIKKDRELRKLFVEENYKDSVLRIEDKVDGLSESLGKINEIIDKQFNSNPNLLKAFNETNNEKFRFFYRRRYSLFVGRDQEIKNLIDFFNNPLKFSWWIITGRGGVGKSRLALELCYALEHEQNIQSGFISFFELTTFPWHQWRPRKHTLIIVDYVASSHENVLKLIAYLNERKDILVKIRFLLIEREINGEWWKGFLENPIIQSCSYRNTPLQLNGLVIDDLIGIVKKVLYDEKKDIILSDEELSGILIKIDPKKRPLFALFIGVALSTGQHIRDWNQYDLLRFQLTHEENIVKNNFHDKFLIEKHKNLLIISTIYYGLTKNDVEAILEQQLDWLPTSDEFDFELYQALSGYSELSSDVELSPLLPDIFGEFFVLENLSINPKYKFRKQNTLAKINSLANSVGPYVENSHLHIFVKDFFVRRILQDFPSHPMTVNFMWEDGPKIISNSSTYGKQITRLMYNVFAGNLDTLKVLWKYAKLLAEDDRVNKPEKYLMPDPFQIYQEATLILIVNLKNYINEQLHYYEIMRDNTDYLLENDKGMIVSDFSNNDFSLDEIKELHSKITSNDIEHINNFVERRTIFICEVPFFEAIAIGELLQPKLLQSNPDYSKKLIERLYFLAESFTDPRIRNKVLDIFINYGPSKLNEFEEYAKSLYGKIKNTPNQISYIDVEKEKINFIVLMINFLIKNDQIDDIKYYFDDFFEYTFAKQPHPRNVPIILQLANMAYDLCYFCHNKGNHELFQWMKAKIDFIIGAFMPNVPNRLIQIAYDLDKMK